MRALVMVLLSLLLFPASSAAQDASSGAVTGNVASQNSILLEGADVVLDGFGTIRSDSQGRFTFTRVPPGNYRLNVSKQGFTSATRAISVRAGYTAQVDVILGGVADVARTQGHRAAVPLIRAGNSFLVRALINGRREVVFVLDTGASLTTISTALARDLGLNVGADSPTVNIMTASDVIRAPLATVGSIQVGGLEAPDVRVAVFDLPGGTQLAGLLGNSFLSRFHVQLDAMQSVLTLTQQ